MRPTWSLTGASSGKSERRSMSFFAELDGKEEEAEAVVEVEEEPELRLPAMYREPDSEIVNISDDNK